jgi:curved DNA-binding protein CbpA
MNFSNDAAIATLKVINERMDYLSNEVRDRTYDQLMELNQLGEMRQQLERETFIDYTFDGKQETDSVDNIKRNGQLRVRSFDSCRWADPVAAKMTHRGIRLSLVRSDLSGLISREEAANFATLITESLHVQCIGVVA